MVTDIHSVSAWAMRQALIVGQRDITALADLARGRLSWGRNRQAHLCPLSDEAMARLARALAHPTRVAIVRHTLQSGEGVCTDLSEVVPLAHSTAMPHIKILKEAGLLRSSRHGRHVLYL